VTSPWLADIDVEHSHQIRSLVRESWERAEKSRLDPDRLLSPLQFESDELGDYRQGHPLASVMPVIRKLLVQDADNDSGMLVAVGDAMGRLLWVEGDTSLKRRAESMMFVEGADWSETAAGTSAPGTALALDHAIQIRRDEHFNRLVHAWSCTAVPVHDPETRNIIGVIDITGGEQAVDRHTMPLMEATAHAVESELLLQRFRSRQTDLGEPPAAKTGRGSRFISFDTSRISRPPTPAASVATGRATMHILGRDTALLSVGERSIELTRRHAEIVTLLSWNRAGLSAERLTELLNGSPAATSRLRSEMVRLRKILDTFQPGLAPTSKPYRLPEPIELDAQQVVGLLDRGAHRAALAAYRGAILPGSTSPGIQQIRDEVASHLREALLGDAAVEVLLEYAHSNEGMDDLEVWKSALRLLPPKSPKRAGVVGQIERIESQ
jgi:transcriptional regulator of acetoin/glycerol metabolism